MRDSWPALSRRVDRLVDEPEALPSGAKQKHPTSRQGNARMGALPCVRRSTGQPVCRSAGNEILPFVHYRMNDHSTMIIPLSSEKRRGRREIRQQAPALFCLLKQLRTELIRLCLKPRCRGRLTASGHGTRTPREFSSAKVFENITTPAWQGKRPLDPTFIIVC
jgi:hypothetical protein